MLDNIKSEDFYKKEKQNILDKKEVLKANLRTLFRDIKDTLLNVEKLNFETKITDPEKITDAQVVTLYYSETLFSVNVILSIQNNELIVTPILKADLQGNNTFSLFDNVYDKFKSHLNYINKNKSYFKNFVLSVVGTKNKILNIQSEINTNQYLCFLAKNLTKFKKITNIFKVTPLIDIETVARKRFLSLDLVSKLAIKEQGKDLKFQFVTYEFHKHAFQVKTDSFRISDFDNEELTYKYRGDIVSKDFVLKLLEKSFLFNGERIYNRKQINHIPFNQKGTIQYQDLYKYLEKEFFQDTIKSF